jgi:RNA recognition motif. (a.k.a. RRM, RBD, or RNP domain)
MTSSASPWDLFCKADYDRMNRSDVLWGNLLCPRDEMPTAIEIVVSVTPIQAPVAAPGGKHVRFDLSKGKVASLRVGGLCTSSDPRKLRETLIKVFGIYGDVNDVHLPIDRVTRCPRGFAFVEYRDHRDAYDAILNEGEGGSIDLRNCSRRRGDPVSVEYATAQRKTSDEMRASAVVTASAAMPVKAIGSRFSVLATDSE